jgi:CubicO group peptidase (beta-lactamase class C family)
VTVRVAPQPQLRPARLAALFAQPEHAPRALAAVLQTPVGPPGEVVYSDLGFMLLGAIVERVAHERLDAFAAREVFDPLDMLATRFGPLDGVPVAATEDCGWRDRLLEGEVHDENATVWDGVAGHAGLFGTVGDLARYAHAWLTRDELGPEELLRRGDARAGGRAGGRPAAAAAAWVGRSAPGVFAGPARAASATPASPGPRCGSTPRRATPSCC